MRASFPHLLCSLLLPTCTTVHCATVQHNGRGERDEGQAQVPRVDRALPRAATAVARCAGRLTTDAYRPGDPAADGRAQADGLRLAPLRALRLPRIPLHEGMRVAFCVLNSSPPASPLS